MPTREALLEALRATPCGECGEAVSTCPHALTAGYLRERASLTDGDFVLLG